MTRLNQINEQERKAGDALTDCLVTPRTQICLTTNPITYQTPRVRELGIKNEDMLTQWWNMADTRKNGKGIINVGAIDRKYFEQLDLLNHGSAHIIAPNHTCHEAQKFQIYHYAGNEEQRTFRDAIDPRGGYSNRKGGSLNPTEQQCKGQRVGDIKPWIDGFVDDVGADEAKRLLEGTGRVHGWPSYQ